jgi:multiple sugar transport system permease protein
MQKQFLIYLPLLVITAIWLFPIYWAISTSFKPADIIFSATPTFVFTPTITNYGYLFGSLIAYQYHLLNSLIIALGATVVCTIVGTLAAYSINRFTFRGRQPLAFLVLSVLFIPPIVVLIPLYQLYSFLGLLDTHLGLILANSVYNLPIAVWLMQSFFAEIPRDLDDAAMIDGRTRLGAFFRIVLPLSAPGASVTALFVFLFTWDEFLSALVLTSRNALPASVNLLQFLTISAAQWGPLLAAATIMWIPPVLAFVILQRYIVRGLTFGAVK